MSKTLPCGSRYARVEPAACTRRATRESARISRYAQVRLDSTRYTHPFLPIACAPNARLLVPKGSPNAPYSSQQPLYTLSQLYTTYALLACCVPMIN